MGFLPTDAGLCGQRLLCGLVCRPATCTRLARERQTALDVINKQTELLNTYITALKQLDLEARIIYAYICHLEGEDTQKSQEPPAAPLVAH